MRKIYLDHAASTPLHPKALETLQNSFQNDFANPGAAHLLGRKLAEKIESCRQYFLEVLKAPSQGKFIFTSSATEGNNFVLQGLLIDRFLVSFADHPSLTKPLQEKAKLNQGEIWEIPLRSDGIIHWPNLSSLISEISEKKPILLVISHINNQSGGLQNLPLLCHEIKKLNPKIFIHVDAVQSFAKVPLDLRQCPLDSLTISAHKMGGPKGVAGVYLSPSASTIIRPLLYGGGQEMNLRSSTENAPLIFSWVEACKNVLPQASQNYLHLRKLTFTLYQKLRLLFPQIYFPFVPSPEKWVDLTFPYERAWELGVGPALLTFILPPYPSDVILRLLEEKNIFIASSSACSSKLKGSNPVFSALHIPKQWHKNVLRVSFSPENTLQDATDLADALAAVIKDLSSLITPGLRLQLKEN